MKEGYKEITLLQQREIEARVLAPLIRAFCSEFGEERALGVVRRAIQDVAREAGRAAAAAHGGGLESLKKNCIAKFNEGGALTVTPRRDDGECCVFDVTRCKFAELYKELGCADLGAALSCERDAAFLEGFDEGLEFERSETLMEGGARCDFCYRKRSAE